MTPVWMRFMVVPFVGLGLLAAAEPPASEREAANQDQTATRLDEPEDAEGALTWLFRSPPDEADLTLRVTSVDIDGERRIARLTLQFATDARGGQVAATVEAQGQATRRFRGTCAGPDGVHLCDEADPNTPVARDTLVPGTLLPWQVVLLGWCREFRVASTMPADDGGGKVVEVVAPEGDEGAGTLRLRVTSDPKRRVPTRIASLDEVGAECWTLEIVETRRTRWGPVALRSVFRSPAAGGRALIEVRGGHASSAREPDDENPADASTQESRPPTNELLEE